MSKIDLSKANVGDKFRAKGGQILVYSGECVGERDDKYELIDEDGYIKHFFQYGVYLYDEENDLDLVEQVFDDEKDRTITDKILKDVEKVVNGVAEAMPHIESTTIANLPRDPLPENNEDDAELQRRQEVVELAYRIFTEKYLQEWYQYLIDNKTAKTDYVTYIFEWAENLLTQKINISSMVSYERNLNNKRGLVSKPILYCSLLRRNSN